jgi:hypothetical protein
MMRRLQNFVERRRGQNQESVLHRDYRFIFIVIDRLLSLHNYTHMSHVVYKRSAPFFPGDRYRPDLSDLLDAFADLRILVTYRDPRASAFSSFRRKFFENIKQCAVVCEEQLTYLSAQLATLAPHSYRVISYEGFCSQPQVWVERLAEFCGLPVHALLYSAERESIRPDTNDRWQEELDPSAKDFLIKFFDARRLSQWRLLVDCVH